MHIINGILIVYIVYVDTKDINIYLNMSYVSIKYIYIYKSYTNNVVIIHLHFK